MPTEIEQFNKAARQAAKTGEAERSAQAKKLAETLRTDPDKFDPKALIALGRSGLEMFEAAIKATPVPLSDSAPTSEDTRTSANLGPEGWAGLRRPEIGLITQAVCFGVLCSVIPVAAALLVRILSH